MKNLIITFIVLSFLGQINAQQKGTGTIVSSKFHVTKPLSEIFSKLGPAEAVGQGFKESPDKEHREPPKYDKTGDDGPAWGNEPKGLQKKMGEVEATQQKVAWSGQAGNGSFRPYDPSGAVGPNHYVQMINSTIFRIYTKTGSILLTGTLGNLWNPPTGNSGDPIVLYDKAADRWLLAQFGTSTDRKIYIAISTTNNPTGSYYTYTYVSPQFPDYLKFSVWHDGYYMTSNQSTQKVFAFERSAMLSGTPGARAVYVTYSPPRSGFFTPLAADASDGNLPVAGTPCPIMSYSDNGWGQGFQDAVNIYNMTVNWGPQTPTASISLASNVATQAFDASYNTRWNDCSQPGTRQKLDGIGGVCMYRAQWKTWAGYNSVVLNWAVRISNNQRSIKWCELRQNQSTGVWSMYQEGIYTPDANTRWMGSIAMDNNGSIGLSYIKSNSSNIFPGLFYTGRRDCDPLGTLPVTEVQVVAGTGSQTNTNRVGDYAQLCLDPDGLTFWCTSEYMGGTTGSNAARTYIYSYQITPCNGGNLVADRGPQAVNHLDKYENISHVQLANIDHYSEPVVSNKISDFTNISTELIRGNSYPLYVQIHNAFSTDKINVYCDWNGNGAFDSGEMAYSSLEGVGPYNSFITIPESAKLSSIKMRIELIDQASQSIEEIEEYTLRIVSGTKIENSINLDSEIGVSSNALEVLPNPNQGQFVVKSNSTGEYYLLDNNGKLIEQFKLDKSNNYKHSISGLSSGLYILSGQNAKGLTKQKIIVQ